MKIDVFAVGSYQKRLEFAVPPGTVKEELDTAFRDVSRRARIDGFRRGKVPRQVLEMRFGPQIRNDVATALIQKGYNSALEEHKFEPVSRPQVSDRGEISGDDEFRFTITVDVKPVVELRTYTGLEVVYPVVEVSDEELAAVVKSRLEGQAKLTEVTDRPVKAGDMVIVELTAKDGETVVAQEPGTMIRTEADPYYPGVEALIIGAAVGEEKSGKVAFSADARTETVAGKELDVTIKVVSIQANEIPALTEEIATEMGYEGGVEGMNTALRLQVQQQREGVARNQARANLLQVLINANPFIVPDAMIESHLQMLIEELKLQQAYRGRDPRRIQFSQEQMDDLRIRADFAAKGGLILDYVSKKEDLKVTDDDLEAKYLELADQRGQTVEAIKGYFVKDNAVEELRARLLEEKCLDWLLERAKIVTSATQAEVIEEIVNAAAPAASTDDAPAEAPPTEG